MNSDQRKHVWGHNGLRGGAKMIEKILCTIESAPSTSIMAKAYARQMIAQGEFLQEALKERVDPKGMFK